MSDSIIEDAADPATPMAVLEAIAQEEARLSEIDAKAKPLRQRMSALEREKAPVGKQLAALDAQRAGANAKIVRLERMLAIMRGGVAVSDHAVVRYLERRHGFDFEEVRREIATPELCSAAAAGASGWKVNGGTFKIRNGVITTYIASRNF